MVKRLRYRSENFTLRDAFDLACVLKAKTETVLTLAAEVGDTIPRAKLALGSLSNEKMRLAVRVTSAFEEIQKNPVDLARSGLDQIEGLRDNPISDELSQAIERAIDTLDHFEPGSRQGTIRFRWTNQSPDQRNMIAAIYRERPIETKAAISKAWSHKDPVAFPRWDSHGRPSAKEGIAISAKIELTLDR